MVLKINKYLVFQVLILKVLTTSAQHSIKQYLHVTGVGPHAHSAGLSNLPTVGLAPRQSVPNTGLAALSALALPALISSFSSASTQQQQHQPVPQLIPQTALVPTLKTQPTTPPVAPTKTNSITTNSQGLDSNVLNNLAIALQLLIVSNILNSNLQEIEANPIYEMLETVKNIPVSLSPSANSNQGAETPSFLQNANFVGSSGFTDTSGVIDPYTKPNSRNNYALMSPYEALGPNSPYSDPILASPYGSVMSSKKDFHSPYAMMDSDLFSVSDVF